MAWRVPLLAIILFLIRRLTAKFKTGRFKMSSVYALVAQSVEQLTCNEKVVGSIPIGGSSYLQINICKCFNVK